MPVKYYMLDYMPKKYIKYLITMLLTVMSLTTHAEKSVFSLVTHYQTEKTVYTAWGHSALRVTPAFRSEKDPFCDDWIYNYGLFSFGDYTKFVYNFVLGRTDYMVGSQPFKYSFREAVKYKKVSVREAVLNLTDEEVERLDKALQVNEMSENCVYRYSFFFDNCATRPRLMLEKCVNGTIDYHFTDDTLTAQSYRQNIGERLSNSPWFNFGIYICLGEPTDRNMSDSLRMFEPVHMHNVFTRAEIVDSLGNRRPLVVSDNYLHRSDTKSECQWTLFTPNIVFWVMFLLVVAHTIFYYRRKKDDYIWFDSAFYSLYGILGILVFFLSFISEHACVFPNYNILFFSLLYLLCPVLCLVKRFRPALKYFHIFAFVSVSIALLMALVSDIWIWVDNDYFTKHTCLQSFHPAFYPIMLSLMLRSGSWMWRYGVRR